MHEHEAARDTSTLVLRRLLTQVAVEGLDAAREGRPVVLRTERLGMEVRRVHRSALLDPPSVLARRLEKGGRGLGGSHDRLREGQAVSR